MGFLEKLPFSERFLFYFDVRTGGFTVCIISLVIMFFDSLSFLDYTRLIIWNVERGATNGKKS